MASLLGEMLLFCVLCFFGFCQVKGDDDSGILLTVQPGPPMLRVLHAIPSDFSTNQALFQANVSSRITTTNARYRACAADFQRKHVYAFDTYSGSIYAYSGFSRSGNYDFHNFHRGTSRYIVKLAVDWISNNVYWTDSRLRRIVVQAGYSSGSNSTKYRVLIDDNLERPFAIAVDPREGYLFWSDAGKVAKFERSSLSGSDRQILAHKGILLPYGMTLDLQDKAIYWVDAARDTVETMTYSGANRRVVLRHSHTLFFDIALLHNTLVITELNNKLVQFRNKATGRQIAYSYNQTSETYYGVTMYHEENQPSQTDFCANLSCSDLCVTKKGGATCICREGFEMDSTGNCQETAEKYYRAWIFSDGQSFCATHIREYSIQCFYNVTSGKTITAFDVDMVERKIIFALNDTIYTMRAPPASQNLQHLISTNATITSLALDWRDKNVYWTAGSNINVASQLSRTERTLVSGLVEPRDLIIIPHKDKLLWISGSVGNVKVEDCRLDGTGRTTLVSSGRLEQPESLTYDPDKQQIYWTDTGYIRRAEFNGSSISTMETSLPYVVPTRIHVYRGRVIWTADTLSYLFVSNTARFKPIHYYRLTYGSVTIIRVLDATLQPETQGCFPCLNSLRPMFYNGGKNLLDTISTTDDSFMNNVIWPLFKHVPGPVKRILTIDGPLGPCDVENGQCAQICLPHGQNRTCDCEYGYVKGTDGRTCLTTHVLDNFALLTDWTHNRIYQVDLDTQQVNAIETDTTDSPTGVVFDRKSSKAIWGSTVVRSVFLNGTGNTRLSNTEALGGSPDRFAVDETTGNVFYTGVPAQVSAYGWVGVITPQGDHRTLIRTGNKPRAIQVDPKEGLMFWTDFSNPPFVAKANMDGTEMVKIIKKDLVWPNGLAINYTEKMLYYTDGYLDVIKKCTYDGECTEFLKDPDAQLMAIDMDETYIYYTAWQNPDIKRVKKTRPDQIDRIASNAELGRLDSISIYKSSLHQPINIECSSRSGLGDCSDICLPTSTGHSCACPDGVSLQPDQRLCEGATTCPLVMSNGVFTHACSGLVEDTCQYTCSKGFAKMSSVVELMCLPSGSWNYDTTQLCSVTCPLVVSNGVFTPACSGLVKDTCQYTCSKGFAKMSSVVELMCLPSGSWNYDTTQLCSVTCPLVVSNGVFTPACSGLVEDTCQYTCSKGFAKMSSVVELMCLPSGSWNYDTTQLCSVTCPLVVSNGVFTPACSGLVDDTCQYTCSKGFVKKSPMVELMCLPSGLWNYDTTQLCSVTCPLVVSNGVFTPACSGLVKDTCQYICSKGFVKKTSVEELMCLPSGLWNYDTTQLCSADIPVTLTTAATATVSISKTAMYAGVGGGVGGVFIMVVIGVVVVVILLNRKRNRDSNRPIYVDSSLQGTSNDLSNPNYASFKKEDEFVRDSTYDTIVEYEADRSNGYVTLGKNRSSFEPPYNQAPPPPPKPTTTAERSSFEPPYNQAPPPPPKPTTTAQRY